MKTFLPLFVFVFLFNFASAQIDSTKVHKTTEIPDNAVVISNQNLARMLASEKQGKEMRKNTVFLYKSKFYGFDEFMGKFKTKELNVLKIITDKKAIAKLTQRPVKRIIVVK